jgi:hypothetical protein
MTAAEKAAELARKIRAEVIRGAGRGLNTARIFLAARVKETMNVAAPKVRVIPRGGGLPYYRVTTPATAGAPIRKVTGRAQGSVGSRMTSEISAEITVNARSNRGFNYPMFHELKSPGSVRSGQHLFIAPTVERYAEDVATIVGENTSLEVG